MESINIFECILSSNLATPHVVVVDKESIESTKNILTALFPGGKVFTFSSWDGLPYDSTSPSLKCLAERLQCLTFLLGMQGETDEENSDDKAAETLRKFLQTSSSNHSKNPVIVITCVEAIVQKLPPRQIISHYFQRLETGQEFPIPNLMTFFQKTGYERVETVMSPGTFAQRGGLIDCFPVGHLNPVRLDFFGDELESIRTFDPESQRTLHPLKTIHLNPLNEVILAEDQQHSFRHHYRELFGVAAQQDPLYEHIRQGMSFQGMEYWLPLFYESLDSFFDYVPAAVFITSSFLSQRTDEFWKKIQENYKFRTLEEHHAAKDRIPYRPITPESLYLTAEALSQKLKAYEQTVLSPFDDKTDLKSLYVPLFVSDIPRLSLVDIAEKFITNKKEKILICASSQGNLERIQKLLSPQLRGSSSVSFAGVPFPRSFKFDNKIVLVESDFFGFSSGAQSAAKKKESVHRLLELADFQVGDYLVHQDHGIGQYEGLQTLEIHGASHDCLCLIYEGQDKLFLPVENIEVLSFYSSKHGEAVLDRLGGTAWQVRKAKAKKRIEEIAQKLMKIAAKRQLSTAQDVHPVMGAYEEFCKGFLFVETEDQERAIEDVMEDLAKPMPMDRLVCGDVGFGKTEVALRAAFLVAHSKGQVAILAPTTLLARQHFEVFKKRFQNFPLSVVLISRFQTASEIKKIQEDLEQGKINILIGTHALLTPKIKFRNLELLIVDEEQHFGVKQKEHLKEKYPHVHCLSLSATPIPRTLQMAVSGIRDLSLITTPPMERQPIIAKIMPFDTLVVKEALLREKERGGQSFFVCPRVADISKVLPILEKLLPSFKIACAHGQVVPKTLETTIIQFCDRQYDILVSTNIVESGLDIPSANTMIVYASDLFGLGQLYQLRGRVGRSKTQGYAFFTVTADKTFSTKAQRRLEVLQSIQGLGGGFMIASHDMDIRGTGNLVGEEQSGQIKEVGLGLYQHMLEEAIQMLKAKKEGEIPHGSADQWLPQINLGLEILIPDTYVPDLNLRLGLYQRIGALKTAEEVDDFRAELRDRFGPVPPETDNLLLTVSLKNLCKAIHVHKIEGGPKGILVSFYQDNFPWPDRLLSWIQQHGGTIKIRPDQKLVIFKVWSTPQEKIEGVYKILSQLIKT
ncbi:MAG: transcription-repair coupling factor [Alphaproteobacteria bacterium]